MHDTAHTIGRLFLRNYAKAGSLVVELGSMNVNGTLRDTCPETATYVGLDFQAGPGVDIVVKPNAPLPLASGTADIVIASSVFEHDLYFWETFLELVRIVKPKGTLYINTPSNGRYHRYPADNWRFYPDCSKALESWARRNGHTLTLLESFIAERQHDIWNDFAAVFIKGEPLPESTNLLLCNDIPCTNVWRFDQSKVLLEREASEDMVLIERLRREIEALQHDEAHTAATPFLRLKRLFRRFTDKHRKKTTRNLIPHIGVAFPNIAARLTNPSEKLDPLSQEIARLLDLYAAAWPFDADHYLSAYPDVAEGVRAGKISSAWERCRTGTNCAGRPAARCRSRRPWHHPAIQTPI